MIGRAELGSIILVGMAGVGKSAVGKAVAERLGRPFIDTDALIESTEGESIARIFERAGENGFRAVERQVVAEMVATLSYCSAPIIATGGYTIGDPGSRLALESIGTLIRLIAPPDVIAARAAAGADDRPLLAAADAAVIAKIETSRRSVYGTVPWCVETGGRDIAGAAEAVIALWREVEASNARARGAGKAHRAGESRGQGESQVRAMSVETPPVGEYPLLVGPGLLELLGAVLVARGISGDAAIVTDTNVEPLYAGHVRTGLERMGVNASVHVMGVGEGAKSPDTVLRLVEDFSAAGFGRDLTVIALGGGVVTDTAGFAAATYLRGVRLVNVPTTLLAMVDASLGGKTGVNLRAGKNLLGAFHQPALVVADPAALRTLPPRTLRAGLAEIMKVALIDSEELLAALEGGPPSDIEGWTELIARSAAIKAEIVAADPHERTGGRRELLNFGHTFAHAIEHVSDHAVPHGEAVSIGLVLATRLSAEIGIAQSWLAEDIAGRLESLGLPSRLPDEAGDTDALLTAMGVDKKRRDGKSRFVLIRAPGSVFVSDDVAAAVVRAVLERG